MPAFIFSRYLRSLVKVPLHWVLVVPFVLPTVGAVGLVGYFSYCSGQEAVEDLAHRLLVQVSERVSDRLDRYLQTSQQIVLSDLNNLLHQQKFSASGQVFIIERSGYLVATSSLEKLYVKPAKGQAKRLLAVNSRNALTREIAQQLINQFGSFHDLKTVKQLNLLINNQQHFVQVTPYQDNYGIDWLIVVIVRQSDFMDSINKNLWRTIWLCGLTFLGTTAVGILSAYCITKPIRRLSRASQALAAGNAQLNDIFNSAIAAISSFRVSGDGSWEINYISAGCEFISGYTPAELQADKNLWISRIFPRDWETIELRFYADIFAQQTGTYEYRLYHKNGSLHWISQTNSSRWDETLNCWIVTAVSLDITERKQAEEALRQNEERFQQLAAASPGVIYTVIEYPSGPMCYEYLSPAFEEIHEIPVAEVLQDASITFNQIHPDDQEGYQQAVKESLQIGKPFKHEWRIITPSGKIKWIQANSRLQRRENGELAWHGVVLDISEQQTALRERKQAQEALRQSEERFQEIAHTVNQFFFVRSVLTGEYLYVSPGYEKIWHRSCESLYQNPDSWLETIHPEDRELVLTSIKQQWQEQTRREYRIIRPGGEIRWISAEVSRVKDEAGKCLRVVGLAEDITDSQKIAAALLESEQTNRALVQSIPDLLIRMNRNGTYLDIRTSEGIKLFNPHKLQQGASIFDLLPLEIAQQRFSLTQTTLATGEVQIQEYQLEIEEEIYYEEARIVPCGLDDVLIIVRDVTEQQAALRERKRMETALRESEERFRRAFDDAAIGMALVALDGRFLQVNIALCEITGYNEAELLGNFFQDITHPDDLEKDLEYMRQVLTGKCRTYQMEKRYIHKSGHLVWGLLGVSMVKDQQGNCLYFVSQIQDISERHKIDRIKDEFISIVSHELRTPLTAIRGSLGILESGVLDNRPEKAKYMLQVAVKNSDRLVRLVNDILDLERLESGKVKFVMEKCQVEDLMQQAVESVQAIANQAQIKLEVTHLVAEIWASSDAIIQALINLLSNAIKFSPPHSIIWLSAERKNSESPTEENPTVDAQAIPELPPTSYILFQVRDRGRGIPAEKLETIFGRFQQVDLSDSRQKGGTGLGLAICKSIVQQHEGKIWVESVLGQGSAFYFTLPIKSQEV